MHLSWTTGVFGNNVDSPCRSFDHWRLAQAEDQSLLTAVETRLKQDYITIAALARESSNKLAALLPGVPW